MNNSRDIRCPHCNKLLAKIEGLALVEVKCPRCNLLVRYPTLTGEIVVEERPESSAPAYRRETKDG